MVVEHLLAQPGIQIDAPTRDKMTPLIDSAMNGKGEVLALLLSAGADPHLADEHGRNSLHYASKKGHTSLLKPLLATGLDINLRDGNGWTPLMTAVWHGQAETMEALIQTGADTTLLYAHDLSLLHLAIQADQPAVVKYLAKDKSSLEFRTSDSWTPCYSAAWGGKVELVKILLGAGADLESKNYAQNIPLHIAAYKGHAELVSYLLNLDETEVTESVQKTAMEAIYNETVDSDAPAAETVKEAKTSEQKDEILVVVSSKPTDGASTAPVKSEAEVSSKNKAEQPPSIIPEFPKNPSALAKRMIETCNQDGETPLMSASIHGHTKVVKVLLATGADCNAQRESGATPLHLAARGGYLDAVKLLLDHGADPNIQNKSGRVPLHYTPDKNYEAIIKILLERGADPNFIEKHGRSPLQRALAIGAATVAKMLFEAGADPFAIDDMGRSCEDWAVVCGVDLEINSGPEQSRQKRRKRDTTIKKLLDEIDLSRCSGFDVLGRILMYDGRDLDAQICFERPAWIQGPDEDAEEKHCKHSKPEPKKSDDDESANAEAGDAEAGAAESEATNPASEPPEEESPSSTVPDIDPCETPSTSSITDASITSSEPETTDPPSSETTQTTPTSTQEPTLSPSTPKPSRKILHRACCDGCPNRPRLTGLRYVCRSCEDRDLCSFCFEKYYLPDSQVNVPGCKGHKFLKVPQEWWEGWDKDGGVEVMELGGAGEGEGEGEVVWMAGKTVVCAREWLEELTAEWGWRVLLGEEGLEV
jgi:ankyrin repeat protein